MVAFAVLLMLLMFILQWLFLDAVVVFHWVVFDVAVLFDGIVFLVMVVGFNDVVGFWCLRLWFHYCF